MSSLALNVSYVFILGFGSRSGQSITGYFLVADYLPRLSARLFRALLRSDARPDDPDRQGT